MKASLLMQFNEMNPIYFENNTKHLNKLYWQNTELLKLAVNIAAIML
jgi:hypothetical protein